MKQHKIHNTSGRARDGFAGAELAPVLRMNRSTGTIIRTVVCWYGEFCEASLEQIFSEVVMTNETEIFFLVLAIVATLIVKFVLTKTSSHRG